MLGLTEGWVPGGKQKIKDLRKASLFTCALRCGKAGQSHRRLIQAGNWSFNFEHCTLESGRARSAVIRENGAQRDFRLSEFIGVEI
jgi:hypothetical protein